MQHRCFLSVEACRRFSLSFACSFLSSIVHFVFLFSLFFSSMLVLVYQPFFLFFLVCFGCYIVPMPFYSLIQNTAAVTARRQPNRATARYSLETIAGPSTLNLSVGVGETIPGIEYRFATAAIRLEAHRLLSSVASLLREKFVGSGLIT